MSDELFRKAFGDEQPTHIGTGWVSGVSAVFLGLLGLGGTLCLRFPQLLTLPDARAKYPVEIMRVLIQGVILTAFVLAAVSGMEREYIRMKLDENGWNISKTAEVIGTPRSNLYKKLEQYQISQETDG